METNESPTSTTTVWVVLYGYEDGTGVSVHLTKEGAEAARQADVEAAGLTLDQLESYNDPYYSDGLCDAEHGALWWAVEQRELS